MNCQKCKHKQKSHGKSAAYPTEPLCYACFNSLSTLVDSYHEFQIDNLDYIEQLAKERNLI